MSTPSTNNAIEVPQILNKTQVQFFIENGYLVLENLIAPAEIEELKTETLAIARGNYPCEGIAPAPRE